MLVLLIKWSALQVFYKKLIVFFSKQFVDLIDPSQEKTEKTKTKTLESSPKYMFLCSSHPFDSTI
jgi:hypothetical protein